MKQFQYHGTMMIIIFSMLLSTFVSLPGVPEPVSEAQASTNLNIGDYVQFGKYYNDPILWRVIHKDANGNPMLFADRILTLKPFDAKGNYHTGNANRVSAGSNYYPDSNIRQWLNSSSANSGEDLIDWIQNDPSDLNVTNGWNEYNTEKGFLADGNFTAPERSMIEPLTHKVLLASADEAKKDGGTLNHIYNDNIKYVDGNYDTTANFVNVTDKVFLLSVKQLKDYVYNKVSLTAKPTHAAVVNSQYISAGSLNSSTNWHYWLNTPKADTSNRVRTYYFQTANPTRHVQDTDANFSIYGVRPALQLDIQSVDFLNGGAGTSSNPYVVWDGVSDIEAPTVPSGLVASNITKTSVTVSWTASSDNVGVTAYDVYRGSALIGTVSGSPPTTTYQVTGLIPGNAYSFFVKARDAAGNVTAAGTSLNVSTVANNAQTVNIGDYIQFGQYYNEPILWRVIHYDDDGDPVLFSDKIISLKAFDAAGDYHTGDSSRVSGGSNYYPDSNIRQWLNSSSPNSEANPIDWLQNDPSAANLLQSHNPYFTEKGFLADGNFSVTERSLMKPLTHKVVLNQADEAKKDGGLQIHNISNFLISAAWNHDQSFHKNVTDHVFLLSVKQLKEWVVDRSSILGANYHLAKPTAHAISNSTYKNISTQTNLYYWLNTPNSYDTSLLRIVMDGFNMENMMANYGAVGVRPGLKLRLASTVFATGDSGTAVDPFVVTGSLADTAAPSAPTGLHASNLTDNSLTLNWSASTDNIGVEAYDVYRGTTLLGTVSSDNGNLPATSYNVSVLNANTSYTFSVRAKDAAGNVSASSTPLIVSTLVSPLTDMIPPTVPVGFTVSGKTATGFTLTWKTSKDSGGSGLQGYEVYLGDADEPLDTADTAKYVFTNLEQATTYQIRVLALDNAGNKSAKNNPAYSVATAVDTISPSVPNGLSHDVISPTSFRLKWLPSTDNVAVAGYEVFKNGVSLGKTENTFLDVTGLAEDTVYSMTVKAYDVVNKMSAASAVYSAMTYLDQEAPSVPTDLLASNVTADGFVITWAPSTDNKTVAGYEIYLQTEDAEPDLIGTTEIEYFEFNDLLPDTSYTVTIKAFDAAGPEANVSAFSEPLEVKTLIDSIAPTSPDNLQARRVLSNSLVLSWEAASDDDGVSFYEIYVDGELYKSNHKQLALNIDGLKPKTAYSLTVVAVDTFGTKSLPSDPLKVMTTDSIQSGPELEIKRFPSVVNERATLRYQLESDAYMVVRILSSSHGTVATPVNNVYTKEGVRSALFSTKNIKNGKYFLQMTARDMDTGIRSVVYRSFTVDHSPPVLGVVSATEVKEEGMISIISVGVSEAAKSFSIQIFNATTKKLVRRLVRGEKRSPGNHDIPWDVRTDAKSFVSDGKYNIVLTVTDRVGLTSTKTGTVTIERVAPGITGLLGKPPAKPIAFKATGKSIVAIRFTLSEAAKVTILIKSSNEQTVRSLHNALTRPAGASTAVWDGKNTAGNLVEEGTYTYVISATDEFPRTSEQSGKITLNR